MADKADDLQAILQGLQAACEGSINATLASEDAKRLSKCFDFQNDLEAWAKALSSRPEVALHKTAGSEYTLALFNVAQGQYRNAFKGLRLVLELVLQATYSSTNLLELKEWLAGDRHTFWARIVHTGDGLFSKRLCNAFFEELADNAASYRTIAETLYTELSECIHGNVEKRIPLPTALKFDAPTFSLWLDKCETVHGILQFALSLRYLKEMSGDELGKLEAAVIDRVGHIASIRTCFGGVRA